MSRHIAAMLAGVTLFAPAMSAQAQDAWPSRRITVVVAAAAGGFADSVARIVAERLSAALGQPIIIENRAGAGGNIGARGVAQSAPDGYSIVVSTASMAINPTLYDSMGYSMTDLVPVAIVGSSPEVIAVHPSHPAKTLAEFLKPADGLPVQFGTAGIGSGSHIAAEYLFRVLAKAPAQHVPHAGGAPAVANVLANQLNSIVATMPALTSHINAGTLRGLGVASARRQAAIPNVPTLAEAGFPDYYAASWAVFFVPAATPGAVTARLNAEINTILRNPEIQARFDKMGFETMINDLPATQTFFQNEVAFWSKRVSAIGVKVN